MPLHSSIRYYPLFVDLRGRRAVVAGAGKVALRKARALVECGAEVTVVAPRREPGFAELPLRVVRREFRAADLDGAFLAFAATDRREVNRRVAAAAKRRGILVNVADAREECDFIVPARVSKGDVQIAISTGGRSPRVAAGMRRVIERTLEENWPQMDANGRK